MKIKIKNKIINSAINVTILSVFLIQPATAATTDDEWQFQLAPLFLWGVSIDGNAYAGPITAPLGLSFTDDVFENLEAVFTFHFEAKKNKLLIFAEYQYVDLTPTVTFANGDSAAIGFENIIGELGGGYLISSTQKTDWELLGGIRYTKQTLSATGLPSPPLPVTDIKSGDTWYDLFAGGRVSYHFAQNWKVITRADIGTGDSNLVWNIAAMVDYRFKEWGSVFAGYKAMDYDFDNDQPGTDGYAIDLRMRGPLLGLNIIW
ncbi:MAG: hypothetical protein V7782_11140 [Psychromonas sp.]